MSNARKHHRKSSTTVEDRIRAEWKKRRHSSHCQNDLILRLARKYKRPCAEIREIVGWPGPNSPGYRDFEQEAVDAAEREKEAKRFRRQMKWSKASLREMLDSM